MLQNSLLALMAVGLSTNLVAADNGHWYVKPFVGLSQISDLSANSANLGAIDGSSQIDLDSGFNAGIGLGYRYNDSVAVEVAWEYRSNDSAVTLVDNSVFPDGNYASNMLFLNGIYYPKVGTERWSPYVGAGLSWMQEIDIDLERNGVETSLSGDGEIGYQVFAGVDYAIDDKWGLSSQLRYGSTTGIDLQGEGNNGRLNDLDYQPVTLQIGLSYRY